MFGRLDSSAGAQDFCKALSRLLKEFQIYRKLNPAIYKNAAWDSAWRLSWMAIHGDNLPLFREACQAMVDSRPIVSGPFFAEQTAFTCASLPDSLDDPTIAVRLAQEAVATDGRNPWFERALGAALYRAGRIDESIQHLDRSVELDGSSGHITVLIFLAMAHHKAGHTERAQANFANARTWIVDRIPELRSTQPMEVNSDDFRSPQPSSIKSTSDDQPAFTPLVWQDRALLKHLFIEAKTVVGELNR